MDTRRLLALVMVAVSAAPALLAHHGTSITYEMDRTITVSGTVDEFDFSYPHPSLFVDVTDDKGQAVKWGVEFLPTPAALRNLGWNRNSIKRGDKVMMGCHPSKSNKPVCALQSLSVNGKAVALGPGAPGGAGGRGQGGPRE